MSSRPFLIVRARIDPQVRQEFEAWHQQVHMPNMMRIPGILDAYRLRAREDQPLSVTLFKFTSDAALQKALASPEAERARADWQHWLDHVRELTVEIYATLGAISTYHHRN